MSPSAHLSSYRRSSFPCSQSQFKCLVILRDAIRELSQTGGQPGSQPPSNGILSTPHNEKVVQHRCFESVSPSACEPSACCCLAMSTNAVCSRGEVRCLAPGGVAVGNTSSSFLLELQTSSRASGLPDRTDRAGVPTFHFATRMGGVYAKLLGPRCSVPLAVVCNH